MSKQFRMKRKPEKPVREMVDCEGEWLYLKVEDMSPKESLTSIKESLEKIDDGALMISIGIDYEIPKYESLESLALREEAYKVKLQIWKDWEKKNRAEITIYEAAKTKARKIKDVERLRKLEAQKVALEKKISKINLDQS